MQDRFKLRCFGKSNAPEFVQGLHDVKSVETKEDGFYQLRFDEGYIAFVAKDQMELIQCTGLKDKNGKLIYEGDIVKIPDNWDEYGMMAGEKREVFFNEGGFRLKPKWHKNSRGHWLEDTEDFEIIGNVYENPELLETKC